MNKFLPARSFIKIWNAKAEKFSRAAELDAMFDGGEFSGPYHFEMASDDYNKTLASVASRFDITASKLENLVYEHDMETNYHMLEMYRGS